MYAYACFTALVAAKRWRSFDATNQLTQECIKFVDGEKKVVKVGRFRTELIDAKSNTDLHSIIDTDLPIGDGVHREPPTVTFTLG